MYILRRYPVWVSLLVMAISGTKVITYSIDEKSWIGIAAGVAILAVTVWYCAKVYFHNPPLE
jgi:hypothetical protein